MIDVIKTIFQIKHKRKKNIEVKKAYLGLSSRLILTLTLDSLDRVLGQRQVATFGERFLAFGLSDFDLGLLTPATELVGAEMTFIFEVSPTMLGHKAAGRISIHDGVGVAEREGEGSEETEAEKRIEQKKLTTKILGVCLFWSELSLVNR